MCSGAKYELAFGLLVICAVTVPDPVAAQTSFRLVPSFNVAQVYDSNLFSLSSDRQTDFITRLTPGVTSEYRSTLWTLLGRYTLDGEHFAAHPALTSMNAREHAALAVGYRPTQRLTLATDAELTKTQTPGELNTMTGLAFTRARAQQVSAHSSLTRRFDRVTSGTIDYRFTDERIVGGFQVHTHAATVGASHYVSLRDMVSVDYRFHEFMFVSDGPASASAVTSHALGVGWTHSMTRRLSISVDGGPRVTNASVAPQLSASVRYHPKSTELSLAYARTQTTAVGLAGIVDSQSVTGTAAWSLRQLLHLRVSPAFYRSDLGGLRADVSRLSVDIVRPIANCLSLDVTLDTNVQQGNLQPAFAHDRIGRHTVVIKLVAAPATRMR
jgi:hypothetical protein